MFKIRHFRGEVVRILSGDGGANRGEPKGHVEMDDHNCDTWQASADVVVSAAAEMTKDIR